MTTFRRGFTLGLLSFAMVVSACAQDSRASACRALFDAANRERRAQGLPELRWSAALATAAAKHAAEMAQQKLISHQLSGEPSLPSRATRAGVHFVWLAENIDESSDVRSIHLRWMKSTQHRANLLDTDMEYVGIGVAQRDGHVYAVEDFAKLRP